MAADRRRAIRHARRPFSNRPEKTVFAMRRSQRYDPNGASWAIERGITGLVSARTVACILQRATKLTIASHRGGNRSPRALPVRRRRPVSGGIVLVLAIPDEFFTRTSASTSATRSRLTVGYRTGPRLRVGAGSRVYLKIFQNMPPSLRCRPDLVHGIPVARDNLRLAFVTPRNRFQLKPPLFTARLCLRNRPSAGSRSLSRPCACQGCSHPRCHVVASVSALGPSSLAPC